MFKVTTNTNQIARLTIQIQSSRFDSFIFGVFILKEGRHSSYRWQDQPLLVTQIFILVMTYLILVIIQIKITPVFNPHTVN